MSLYTNYVPNVRGAVALSDEQLRNCAPSIFASQPIETVSDRYCFLPTSSILKGMRENGWVPVRAEQQSVRAEARRGFQKHLISFCSGRTSGHLGKEPETPEGFEVLYPPPPLDADALRCLAESATRLEQLDDVSSSLAEP
jgi:hypothetical protein